MQLKDLHPRRFFLETWQELDDEATRHRAALHPQAGDALKAIYIYTVVGISLILQQYYGDGPAFEQLVRFVDSPLSIYDSPLLFALVGWLKPDNGFLGSVIRLSDYGDLWVLGYWACWRVLGFLILPFVAVILHPGMRLADLGLTFKGIGAHIWVYGVLFVPVLIAVFIVSFTKDFSTYYPFYTGAHRSLFDFMIWEVFYIAQFFSLEVFFRGFMLQYLRRYMGSSAIFAMVLPYCMIHFGKPVLECFAAIIAGVVLGTLAMRTRSIWCGFFIHVSVALSMDVLAIWQTHWIGLG